MSIIESLGITPGQDGWDESKSEMLEALIEEVLHAEGGGFHRNPRVIIIRNIIQKATGKNWQEIKELLNDNSTT